MGHTSVGLSSVNFSVLWAPAASYSGGHPRPVTVTYVATAHSTQHVHTVLDILLNTYLHVHYSSFDSHSNTVN